MNIFATSDCPVDCAKFLDDKRLRKMCLETAQMLCTAVNEHGGEAPYKSTHKNHPANVWTRTTRENYIWLLLHLIALGNEYYRRFGKVHKSVTLAPKLAEFRTLIPEGERTPFANCAANKDKNLCFKHIENVYDAYKMYLYARFYGDTITPVCTLGD